MTLFRFLNLADRFRVPVDWTMIQLMRHEGLGGYYVSCTLTEVIRYASAQLEHCPDHLLPHVLTLADGREMDWQLLDEALRMLASEAPRDREHAARRCRAVILEILLQETEASNGPLDDDSFFSEYWTFEEFWREFTEVPGGMGTGFLQTIWNSDNHRENVDTIVRAQREWLARERTALGLPSTSAEAEPSGCATS